MQDQVSEELRTAAIEGDGNGRTTRLLADRVFIAAHEHAAWQYDWDVDKTDYIRLLRGFDIHRNASELATFVGVPSIES